MDLKKEISKIKKQHKEVSFIKEFLNLSSEERYIFVEQNKNKFTPKIINILIDSTDDLYFLTLTLKSQLSPSRNHINKIIMKSPVIALEFFHDHPKFNKTHFKNITILLPIHTFIFYLHDHPFLTKKHIIDIITKDWIYVEYLRQHPNFPKNFKI
jgi:hypothetical protein